jgi:hypothetical protein
MADSPEITGLKISQLNGIVEQYRMNIYNLELKFALLMKMLEEKSIFMTDELEKRWPLYMKNNVGVVGPDGIMEGSLVVKFFGEKR